MADFEEEGAANLAPQKELDDNRYLEEPSLLSGQFTDQRFDPFSSKTFSGMAQTDPGVQHDDQYVEEQGNTITGGYTYPGDDLPANFARQQQSHMYGDEASDEVQGSDEGVRGRNDHVSNPFTDEHGDMGMPSGGYGDERPIMGYNPFLNEQDRCRADGHETIEEPYEQGEDTYQQNEQGEDTYQQNEQGEDTYQQNEQGEDTYQQNEQGEDTYQQNAGQNEDHDESPVGHVSLEEAQYYRDQEQEDDNRYQEEKEYQGEHEDDQVNKQNYKEQENQHYEDKEYQHYEDKEDQHYEDKEYQHYEDKEYQHYEDKEDQHFEDKEDQHYEDKEDQHYEDKEALHYKDKEDQLYEDKEAQHYEDKEDQHYEDKEDQLYEDKEAQHYDDKKDQHYEDKEDQHYGDKEDQHYEENVDEVEQEARQVNKDEQEVIPGYRKLEEDADDADLEMDPVENIQEANFKDKPVAVSCNLYGDVGEPALQHSEIVDQDKDYLADDTPDDTRQFPESTREGGETFQGGEENETEERFPETSTRAKFGEETRAKFGEEPFYDEEEEQGLEVNEVDMDQREGEREYLETPTTNIETDAKRYSDVEDKGQEDSQDEQEDDELEQREDKFVQQELKPAKQTDQDLGIVNQAFSDDAECDYKIEKDFSSGKEVLVEENEINPQTAQNVEYIPTDVDNTLDKEIEPMVPEENESSEEDELTTGEYTSEKLSREDEVLIKDHIETMEKGFEPQYQDLDSFSSHQEYRSFADNVSEVTSPDTVPQPLPSPPEPKDMSPFDPNAPSDSPSPCHENLGQHGDTADENNTGDFLAGEVEGETKFGVDGTAITSTNTRNGTFIHSEDEEEEETEEESQQLDQGCVTNTGNTETETSVDDRSGEYAGHAMESNDNALMSMSMEGSFYDDGGELIGGEDRRAQENHYQDEDSYEQQSIQLSQQIQNCFSQPSQEALGQQDTYTNVSSAVNGDIDSILDAPVTAPGLQTPVTEHDSSVDVTESQKFHTNDYASHLAEDTEEPECPGESSIDAVGISSPPDESTHNQEDLEEALGSIQISEPAAQETAEEPSSSVDVVPPEPKSDDALASAAAPAAVAGVAAAAAAAAVSTTKTTSVKKYTSAKAGAKTTTTTTKAVKETKTTNGKPASAKKIEVSTTTVTKTTSKKPTDSRPASAATTEKKSPAKPAVSSPTKSAAPAAPKATGPVPSYAQPITPRKPREAKPSSPEEKKKTPTPRTPSASARTPKTQSLTTTASSTTTTTITKTTVRTTSAAASTTTTSRTAQLARPKSSPTKLTNGTSGSHTPVDNNKSPTKKTETKPGSGTVKVTTEKKEIKVTSKIDAGTKSTTPKSPTKSSTPKTPSASTPKTGEVKEGKEIKSKIGSLEKTNHTPGGGNVKITTKKPDFTNVTSKIGSKDKIDHKPGGGNIKIETKKLKIEAKSKIGSFENATHKPAGGDKKIEVKKMEWNAKSKVGSLENATHVPGGGDKKILSEKLEWKSGSRVGSLDNAKHEPGGGNVKIESRKLDFKEKASPKIGSLDSKKVSTSEESPVPATNGVPTEN